MTIEFDTLKDRLEQWDVYLIEFEYPSTTLSGDLNATAMAVSGDDISDFPNQGYITPVNGEIIEYHLKTFVPASAAAAGFFSVSKRGCFKTAAASAASGGVVKPPFMDTKLWSSKDHLEIGSDLPILQIPRGTSQTIDPSEGKSSIGSMRFGIVDDDNFFSKLSALVPLRNTKVTLKAGYKELPLADFETEWVGLVREMGLSNDHNQWNITCSDLKRHLKTNIFTQFGETKISVFLQTTDLTIFVDSTNAASAGDTKFIDPANYPYAVYVEIDDEIIGPITSMTGTALIIQAGGRGAFGTTAANHDIDAEIKQTFVFGPANPITLALEIMLSTGDGTNHGTYDTLPSEMGMGIKAALVDIDSFESERDEFITATSFQFYISDELKEGKTWIESNILRPTNSFIFVKRNGNISYKISNPPIPSQNPVSIGVDQVISKVNMNISLPNIVNQIRILYSKDPVTEDYIQTLLVIDADSISRHGSSPIREIPLDGVHGQFSKMGDQGGDAIAISVGKYYRSRFAEVTPVVKMKVNLTLRNLSVGNLVVFTWDSLPNWLPDREKILTGKNLSNFMEISSLNPKYDLGEIQITLIGTQYSWRKFAVIGPNSMVDYTDDTGLNKKSYAYFCNGMTKRMSDGSDPSRLWFGGGGSTDDDLAFLKEITDTIGSEFKTNDEEVFDEFHITTGHKHDGSDSRPITSLPNGATFDDDLTVDQPAVMIVHKYTLDMAALYSGI